MSASESSAVRAPAGPLARLESGAWIALIRLRSLGDAVLTTPAIAALKRWRDDLRLAVLIEPAFGAVYAGNPGVDAIVEVPGGAWARLEALAALRRLRPAVALSLHGGATAAGLARASGAPERATFLGLRHAWAYTRLTPPAPPPPGRSRLHTAEHVASLFVAMGMPPQPLGPARLFPAPAARARMRQRLQERGLRGPFAFLHANARSFTMRWHRERYRELGRWLAERYGLACVLAHSPESQGALEAGVAAGIAGAAVLPTTVAELIALIAEAALVVGSDGGPIHVAAALARPTVAIFSATDAVVWGPWQAPARVVQNPYACNPCRADRCYAFAQPECILSVRLEQVQQAIASLLP